MKSYLDKLRNDLRKPDEAFRQTELYKLLKEELTTKGYWKAKPRGNPRKGYKNSPVMQQAAEIRQQLRNNKKNKPGLTTNKLEVISYEPLDD